MVNDEKPDGEEEVVEYLKRNNGKNLHKLGENLVLFLEYKETIQHDSNEDTSYPLSMDEILLEVLREGPKFLYKTDADLTCFNEKDNALIVVEIKSQKVRAEHETFGQILYYITVAHDNLARVGTRKHANGEEVKNVEGIVLANENSIKPSLKYLVKKYENVLPKIRLKKYRWTDEKELIIEDA